MKSIIKPFFLAILMLSMASCSSLRISSDYDKQADFTKYKTYSFTEEALNLPVQQLNRDRVLRAIENEMSTKGFTKTESNPDILVDLFVKSQTKRDATATTTGMGGMYGRGAYRYGYGGGFTTTQIDVNEYVEGTMVLNMIDKGTEKIVWQGVATKTLDENASAEKRESNINYAVKQLFLKYPPKK